MQIILLAIAFILLTVSVYIAMNWLYVLYPQPFLVPILTTTIVLIGILSLFHIPYETYMMGGKWLDMLLGPAVVSLAIPLYKQKHLLKRYSRSIVTSILTGSFTGIVTGTLLAKMVGFPKELVLSVLPKSITTPIAMQVAEQTGGIPPLAAVFVIIAGISGVLISRFLLTILKLDSPLARGIGLGTGAHAIGTARAIEYGEEEASYSSVAMTLSAITGSVLGPLIAWLLY